MTTEFHFVPSPKEYSQALVIVDTEHTGESPAMATACIDGCHPELPLRNIWPEEEFERPGLDDIIEIA